MARMDKKFFIVDMMIGKYGHWLSELQSLGLWLLSSGSMTNSSVRLSGSIFLIFMLYGISTSL